MDGSIFINGLNCLNCRWEYDKGKLNDIQPKLLANTTPLLFLIALDEAQVYEISLPVFRKSDFVYNL